MIKKILKWFGITLLVLIVILNTYMIVTLTYNVGILFFGQQLQLDQLQEKDNQSLNNDIVITNDVQNLKKELDKSKSDIEISVQDVKKELEKTKSNVEEQMLTENLRLSSEINEVKKKIIVEVDKNLILNGSVFIQNMTGSGSGTIIKKTEDSMYILTCYHVIESNWQLQKQGFKMAPTVGYSKSDKFDKVSGLVIYGAEIIKVDEEKDLALLKISINDKDLNEIKIAEINPEKGDVIYSIGHPLGLMRALSKGILTAKIEGFYVSDNTITFGNSGGGLFNIKGELIGVPSQVMGYGVGKDENGEQYFVPESGLGQSINLIIVKEFLKEVEYK